MIVDGERVKEALGIKGATKYGETRDHSTRMAYEIVDAIDDSIIPESELWGAQNRPKGKWIETINGIGGNLTNNAYECSWCKLDFPYETKFCPNCGAEMESR